MVALMAARDMRRNLGSNLEEVRRKTGVDPWTAGRGELSSALDGAVREVPDIDHGVCSTLLHRSRRHQRAHCCRRGTSPPMAGVRSRCTSCPWCTRAGTPRDPRIGRRSCLGRCLLSRSIQRAQHTPWARQVEAAWEALKAAAAMAVWVAAMGLAAGVEDGIRASSRALSSHCTWCKMAIP